MRPPFAYYGGKTRLADRIAGLLPEHRHYVEPFAGSLSVLLAKPRTRLETVNDLGGDLMLFWRVLRDQPEGPARLCALTPHSRAVLCLRILQAVLVYVNTLMIQDLLAEPAWAQVLTDEDQRGLTPLFWAHVLPYGEVKLNMTRRLSFGSG